MNQEGEGHTECYTELHGKLIGQKGARARGAYGPPSVPEFAGSPVFRVFAESPRTGAGVTARSGPSRKSGFHSLRT